MGVYHSVCRSCADELLTASVTDARQHTREHLDRGHHASYRELSLAALSRDGSTNEAVTNDTSPDPSPS